MLLPRSPDGEQGTCLEFVVDGRPLRLLVPSKKGAHDVDGGPGTAPPTPDPSVRPAHLADPSTRPAHLAEPPLFIDLPAPVLVDAPATLLDPPAPTPDEPIDPVVATAPAPTLLDRPVPNLVEPIDAMVATPPAPALSEPPPPTLFEPPAPALLEPPAPALLEPPAPALVGPPAPVLLRPPAPVPVTVTVSYPAATLAAEGVVDDSSSVVGTTDDEAGTDTAIDPATDEDDDSAPVRLPTWFRYVSRQSRESKKHAPTHAERIVRLVVFTVLAGLIPIAAGVRYFQDQGTTGHIAGVSLSDAAIAARVGIQPTDLPGWSAAAPRMGNAFAAGATTHGSAALNTAEQASTVLARCLHVPVSAVDGAFGMGSSVSQRTAEVTSPSYADPAGNGGAVNSVVDVVQSPQVGRGRRERLPGPGLVRHLLPALRPGDAALRLGGGSSRLRHRHRAARRRPGARQDPARSRWPGSRSPASPTSTGQTKTVVTTATAVFDGRVQATLGTVSNLVFSLNAQDQLVRGARDPGHRRGPAVRRTPVGRQPGVRRPMVHSVR